MNSTRIRRDERETLDEARVVDANIILQNDEFDDYDLQDDDLDPLELEITDYLDDALSEEEKRNFEERMRNDPELQDRVERERDALNALNLLDVELPENDLVEATVERLNSETQTELDAALATQRRQKTRSKTLGIVTATVALVAGFYVFSLAMPSERAKREADARVVERLAQLEAVGDLSYLKALAAANLFQELKEVWRNGEADRVGKGEDGKTAEAASENSQRSYQELLQDRVFYRLQRRFEALPKDEQEKWRNLRRQIDQEKDADLLLQTLDDYYSWLVVATPPDERERLLEMKTPERVEEVRRRVDSFVRFAKFVKAQDDAKRANSERNERRPAPSAEEYKNLALRAALPEEVKDENLTALAQKYDEYNRNRMSDDQNLFGEREGVVQFVKDSNEAELVAQFSDRAKEYIEELDPQTKSTLLGLLVSVSYLEDAERKRAVAIPPFRNPNARPRGDFRKREKSLQELADTLKKAPQPARDFILSCPPNEARGLLQWLNWGEWGAWNQDAMRQQGAPQTNNRFGRQNRFEPGMAPPNRPREEGRRPQDFNRPEEAPWEPK